MWYVAPSEYDFGPLQLITEEICDKKQPRKINVKLSRNDPLTPQLINSATTKK